MSNKNIEAELDFLIKVEGGYTNDPSDSGGETNFGITKFVAESFGYTGEMIDLTINQAKDIYRARYWIQPQFDRVFNLNTNIAFELFDTGVNMGTSVASKFLQRALNVLNNGGTIYPDITVDGVIGSITINSLKKLLEVRKDHGESVLMNMLNAQQSVRYIEIAEARPKDEKYEFGWQNNRVSIT